MKFFIVFVLTMWSLSFSAKIHVAQSAAGSDNGTDEANAHAITWFNTAGNWGSDAGDISPGDTVVFHGDITSYCTILGSGASHTQPTVFDLSDANFTNPHWNLSGANGDSPLYANGKSHLVFDGGGTGVIQATDNGTELTYQLDWQGINLRTCLDVTVKNLTIKNLYIRVFSAEDNVQITEGVYARNCDSIFVDSCKINNVSSAIMMQYETNDSVFEVYSCSLQVTGHGSVVIGDAVDNGRLKYVTIRDNYINKGNGEWGGAPEIHLNGIHIWSVQDNGRVDSVRIYNNYFTGVYSTNSTALTFIEGPVYAPKIYNNIYAAVKGDLTAGSGNGYIYLKWTPHGGIIANNVVLGTNEQGMGVYIRKHTTLFEQGAIIKNNIFDSLATGVAMPDDVNCVELCDSNVYSGTPIFNYGNTTQLSYAAWKSASGFDAGSQNSYMTLSTTGTSISSSDTLLLKGKGSNLSNYFTTDRLGRTRIAPWDIGATMIRALRSRKIFCVLKREAE